MSEESIAHRDGPGLHLFLKANLRSAALAGLAGFVIASGLLIWQSDKRFAAEIILGGATSKHLAVSDFPAEVNILQEEAALQVRVQGGDADETLRQARQAAFALRELEEGARLDAAAARLAELDLEIASVQQALAANGPDAANQSNYNALKRNAARQLTLKLLEQQRNRVAALVQQSPPPLSILRSHVTPTNVLMRNPLTVVTAATLAAALLSLAFAAAPLIQKNVILTAAQLRRQTGLVVLGALPEARPKRRSPIAIVMYSPASRLADGLRALRRKLVPRAKLIRTQAVLITSSVHGEGASTTSLLLAQTLANWGKRVLVIDADTRGRTLTKMIKAGDQPGLLSMLAGLSSLEDVTKTPDGLSIDVLPMESASAHAADILSTERLADFLLWARTQYDHILIDAPPVLEGPDACAVAPVADQIVYLARWRKTTVAEIESGLAALASVEAPAPQMLLTRVEVRKLQRLGFGVRDGAYRPASA